MQLTNINEEVTIKEPTDYVTFNEIEREAEGINVDEQKIKKQGDRVTSLWTTLTYYNRIFEQYPKNWADLLDTTDQEIDQAAEAVKTNSNSRSYVSKYSVKALKEELDRIDTVDYFTEENYPYELTDQGYKFTYQISLDKVQAKNVSKVYLSRYVNGLNTANQEHTSVEYQGQKETDSDGDGLTDYQENYTYKTDPTKKDTDGDGFDDRTEIENGFNPNGEGKASVSESSNSQQRDAERISDIKQIQSTLELYYNNQTMPSYPADGVAGESGSTGIGKLLASIGTSDYIPIAPTPPETDCTTDQNSYAYASFSDAEHKTACDEEPCGYYTLSYCLGGETGGIEAGVHTACETGIACETQKFVGF